MTTETATIPGDEMTRVEDSSTPPRVRSVFWPCFWLAVVLCVAKALHGGDPANADETKWWTRVLDLSIFVHADLLFVLAIGVVWQVSLAISSRRPKLNNLTWIAGLLLCVACAVYAIVSVLIFENLGTPLTYPLIHVAGNFGNMRSSLVAYVTIGLVASLIVVPLAFLVLVWACNRWLPMRRHRTRRAIVTLCALIIVANAVVARSRYEDWAARDDRAISQNPHWVLISSSVKEMVHGDAPALHETYPPEFAAEFAPHAAAAKAKEPPDSRPNVIVVVLESVGARYLSIYGSPFDTSPTLKAEAANSLIIDNVYSHVGMTANSMVSMLLSTYPPITWRQLTADRPDFPGTSLAQVMHDAGYRTAYITSADLTYVSMGEFLKNRGFDQLEDVNSMGAPYAFTWGAEDRYMVDGTLKWIDSDAKHDKPFFAMTWTQQTHHPYSVAHDQEEMTFSDPREPSPSRYYRGQYLNALRESDRQLGRLFAGLRERKLDQNTIVIITGDHGEAFGFPHNTFAHGARVYDECLHVPFVIWSPKLYAGGKRSNSIGGLMDLGPTILDLCSVAQPSAWQGTSLLDSQHPPRAYFAAVNDGYYLAVRDQQWKYIFNATLGKEELFDLATDPQEQKNLAPQEADRCRTSRQRLAAWLDSFHTAR